MKMALEEHERQFAPPPEDEDEDDEEEEEGRPLLPWSLTFSMSQVFPGTDNTVADRLENAVIAALGKGKQLLVPFDLNAELTKKGLAQLYPVEVGRSSACVRRSHLCT